ncbi:MAG TPA: hypothetical protein HPP80_00835 [Rhodospirillaceae bacterium]|nr:hypothetical protein [Rhodospirillaceae bacterium]
MTTDLGTKLSVAQAVAYAVLAAQETESDKAWKDWAKGWLSGDDRSAKAAKAVAANARSECARHAARAAELLAEATDLQTDSALLSAEGRNARWQLDAEGQKETDCLAAVAEAIRHAEISDPDGILARAEADF